MTTVVSGKETVEEAYFLLRTAMWRQEQFNDWLEFKEYQSYEVGHSDGLAYARDSLDQNDHYQDEYNKGYEHGYEEGMAKGIDEGYKDGYNDGSREFG